MSMIIRCDCPGCTEQTVIQPAPQGTASATTWRYGHNASGYMVHGHNDAHLALAIATTGDPIAVAVA